MMEGKFKNESLKIDEIYRKIEDNIQSFANKDDYFRSSGTSLSIFIDRAKKLLRDIEGEYDVVFISKSLAPKEEFKKKNVQR